MKGKRARAATSDWMEIEKQRGISVTSSVMQFRHNGFCVNILDTPGHQDFSEDTYRTLMAADSAVMVIDGAKGVEPQTRKLFKVCAMRHIPIFTFINKMDRESRNPFDLLDQIEQELGIKTYRVKAWRDENNLPSNAPNSVRYSHLTLEERTQLRREKAAAYHRKRYAGRRAENPALSARDEQIRERNESIVRLYEQGMNDREIARALGKSDKTICAWRARRNLPTNYDPRAKRG